MSALNMTELNMLRGRLGALKMSITEFARLMELSRPTARKKLDGEIQFKANEIAKACKILNIPLKEASSYFFNT